MKKTLVEKYVEDPIHMRLYQQERAIYEVTELLESLMEEVGVSRSELARRLGKSKGWVTQLLDGEANKTVRTVADAFAVLGREYHSFQSPIRIGRRKASAEVRAETTAPHGLLAQSGHLISFQQARAATAETLSSNETEYSRA